LSIVRHIQAFAAKDAVDIGLGRGAVDMVLRAPVVFGDADWCVFVVVIRNPFLQAWDQLHRVVDPGFVFVVRVPQRTCRAIATQLHIAAYIVAELAALRVDVHRETSSTRLPLFSPALRSCSRYHGSASMPPIFCRSTILLLSQFNFAPCCES
jgi:hypothetical protein